MVTVSRSIHIDAPVEDVFAYLDDPRNHAEVTPSLAEVRNVEALDNGGKRVEHTYKMAGVGLDGELVERVHEENERMVFEMRGSLTGEIEIETTAADGGTELRYSAEYELPGKVLSTVAKPFVRLYNERELQTTLENTKTRLEAGS
ncbi:Polyketide cyclase/dehydrase family protein involved in binding/transport of lipids [Halapricum desulfuricans]|uniref:Polyketide cyclase/dehydrase family protein involved in binding/transport of lipids n=1 Tax=Halapricum desulfuricans TaxID=2841257 RepID=A0A897NG67_9EURY|nr:SRPBCC family protein [Halapricum desulfuricans]QSG11578.1 Polyketide cyclase/dehydrase family protein involved in binding/transport of lipids [Halapricum desulfuricans]